MAVYWTATTNLVFNGIGVSQNTRRLLITNRIWGTVERNPVDGKRGRAARGCAEPEA